MQNNEDCASLVKVFTKKKLDIKAYNCLICVQRSGKEGLRKLQEKEIATFIKSLKMQNLSFKTFRESGSSYDPQEPGPSSSESRATRFKASVSYKGSVYVL